MSSVTGDRFRDSHVNRTFDRRYGFALELLLGGDVVAEFAIVGSVCGLGEGDRLRPTLGHRVHRWKWSESLRKDKKISVRGISGICFVQDESSDHPGLFY